MTTSRGAEESGRRAKVKSKIEFIALLEWSGLVDVEITAWWKLFDRVLARKNGDSGAVGARELSAALRCGSCGQVDSERDRVEPRRGEAGGWRCQSCGKTLTVTNEGIVLN